jgi:hypothetical protein
VQGIATARLLARGGAGPPRQGTGLLAQAAARITVVANRAEDLLAAAAPASFDVDYLDPMFSGPGAAAPGFHLLHRVACNASPGAEFLVRRASRATVWSSPARQFDYLVSLPQRDGDG